MERSNGQGALKFDIPVKTSPRTERIRRWKQFKTTVREWKLAAKAMSSTKRPILAHIIPMRRCNLSCVYCNEYDDHSSAIPLESIYERIDRLAELGTLTITISGGEPLMHPQIEQVIQRIRQHGMISGMITNGYLLSRKRIESLNAAGLEHLQISIDNVVPDEVSHKSLKVLDKKLRYMAEFAHFKININSVLGSGVKSPQDAYVIAKRAVDLGFTCTVGIIHDHTGHIKPLDGEERTVYDKVRMMGKRGYTALNRTFQEKLVAGKPNDWKCRAGARYLYICEEGLVHYCSQQRGNPGIPVLQYTRKHIEREFLTKKSCAPYCTISCVHHTAIADFWRSPQKEDWVYIARPEQSGGTMGDLLQLK